MKKLFALVLTLAMVLAIAAPAMASGWDILDSQVPTLKDIKVAVTALAIAPNTTKLGSIYEPLTTMYPIVAGIPVHFVVEVEIPKAENLSAANKNLIAKKALKLEVDTANIDIDTTKGGNSAEVLSTGATAVVTGRAAVNTTYDYFTDSYGTSELDRLFTYDVWGTVKKDGKDASVTAYMGFYNTWRTSATGTEIFDWCTDGDGDNEYYVLHNYGYYFISDNAATPSEGLLFPVNDAKDPSPVDYNKPVQLYYNGGWYNISKTINNVVTFTPVANPGTIVTEGTAYKAMMAIYDEYFGLLGFPYEDAKYMTEKHFSTYFGTIVEVTATVTYPTGAVVVVTPDVEPPQTGDNASIVGFVMVAIALVAAAAVTVKKVRA